MGFQSLKIKPSYDSDEDDALNEFYIPVLKECVDYKRLAGFFSSTSLAVAAKGIRGLIENNGKMKLLAGAYLSKEDVESIRKAQESPEEVIKDFIYRDLDSIENQLVKNHIMALGWLIANERLEIRVAIIKSLDGSILDAESIKKRGIFHQKVGILKDYEGKKISFSGSINETASAWKNNVEEFKVFRDWVEIENLHFQSDQNKFERYWNGNSRRFDVLEVPQAVKRRLIKMAPKDVYELKLEPDKLTTKKKIKPWPHQRKAIDALKNNSFKGIFKMATGTGKTYTALLSLQQYFEDKKKYKNRILIIVPQHALLEQWVEDLRKFIPREDFILHYDSKVNENSKREARKHWRYKFDKNDEFNIYLVISIDSVNNFKPFKEYIPDFVIGDEIHSYGTKKRLKILNEQLGEVMYRLGMSATPERFYDLEGTEGLLDYFGSIIFSYGIKRAQKDGVLSEYNYYPYLVKLTKEEEETINELTKKIGKEIAINFKKEISEKEDVLNSKIEKLLRERANKIKKSENKLNALRDILKDYNGKLKQCIVYCEDRGQLNKVKKIFDEMKIDSYIIYHSKVINREVALDIFKKENCNYILSIGCLDQGINIPSCESLILLSSSRNPRQYIQRRGRVLRNPPYKIKPIVKIFDILVFPQNIKEEYRGLIMNQLIRAWEFIRCSQSPEAKIGLNKVMKDYNIYSDELDKIIEEW
ncbi:MAG: DEAD/DEAH box helicase family protein [Promethearchaeota archaeon]